ncbi:MAG TPA: ATP-binding protein [Burkholderiales bacterium]
MTTSEVLRSVSLGLGALALVAVLVFLYDKTQAVDLQDQSEILGSLRVLKEIDGRWDVDVLRIRFEPAGTDSPAIKRAAAANKALRDLSSALRKTPSPSLSAGLPQLSEAILQKTELVEKFRVENSAAKAALDGLVRSAAEAQTQAGEMKVPPQALVLALSRAVAAASQYYWLALDVQRKDLEAALAALPGRAPALPETLRGKLEQMREAGEILIKRRSAEQQLFDKLAVLTSGPRLENLTFLLNGELEATLQEKELFRVYLIAYAGALLILIAWLVARLKAANVSLERRVKERTHELSEALQHLKESESQLIQSEKMSSLGQMVAGVAHEINTPLAYVKNSLGTVADKLGDLGRAVEHCEKLIALLQAGGNADPQELSNQFAQASAAIARLKQQRVTEELGNLVKDGLYGAGQMAEIVGNLKDFSRLDRSKVTSFNLNEGLNSTLVLARHLLKSATVDKRFGDITSVVCSPSQVNQVFLNLITNAVQAMEAGRGRIMLTTRNDGGGVAVEVADNGKGIAPEVLPKIFDPFFSTKEVGKGTGLGLSVSYKIIQQHGGRIKVESQLGAGTRFTVWFPLVPPAAAELAA